MILAIMKSKYFVLRTKYCELRGASVANDQLDKPEVHIKREHVLVLNNHDDHH